MADGGWSYGQASAQGDLEPTCLALLALRWDSSPARARGLQFLLDTQNPNGSWPAFSGDDQEGSGLTALAVIALINSGEMALQTERGLKWLLNSKGKESHWLWKWKFRTSDTHVRFDPDKFGWPWMPGTCSWVIPTAFSMIALKQAFVCCKTDEVGTPHPARQGNAFGSGLSRRRMECRKWRGLWRSYGVTPRCHGHRLARPAWGRS